MNETGRDPNVYQEDAYVSAYAARDHRTGAVVVPPAGAVPPKGNGGRVAAIVILCILVVIALVGFSCSAAIGGMTDVLSGEGDASSITQATSPSAVVIDIDSVIDYDGSACSPDGLSSRLRAAQADEQVKGVILRVNSGGGTATAGEEMARMVAEFPKQPVT